MPGADLEQVQRAYRRQIARWHPDRFEAGSPEQRRAEEKTKNLNHAYEALLSATDIGSGRRTRAEKTDEVPQESKNEATWNPEPEGDKKEASSRKGSRFVHAAGLSVLLLAIYTAWLRPEEPRTPIARPEEVAVSQYAGPGLSDAEERDQGPEEGGRPSSDPDVPLSQPAVGGAPRHIRVGSTPSEVLAALGPPIQADAFVWVYGPSRIYFKDGLVIGWHDSTFRPLPVERELTVRRSAAELQKARLAGENGFPTR